MTAIRSRDLSGVLRGAVLVVLVLTAPMTSVYGGVPGAVAEKADAQIADAAPRSLASQLEEARTQLAQARHLRDDSTRDGRLGKPLATNKQRLLDWLVDLQSEKLKRIEDLAALRNAPPTNIAEDPLVKALEGPPPYSALQVDALRDEIDGLKENLAAAEARLQANRAEMQNLRDQLKGRAAAVRRAGERGFTPADEANAAGVREEREAADVMERAVEAELAIAVLEQESLTHRISSLGGRLQDLQTVVARVLPEQRVSAEELAAQRQRVRAEQDKLAAEAVAVGRRYARHRAEHEQFGAAADGETRRRAALLDSAIKADNAILKGLDDLQVLNGVSGDAWEQRYAVLSGTDSAQRRTAFTALQELRQKLANWRSLSHSRQEALRTEIREQRMRIDNLDPGGRGAARETERLNFLLQQAAMEERTELAAMRLERQTSRWLADFDDVGERGLDQRVAWLADRSRDLLLRVWQQELFVAEDVSEVDGRRVAVQYSVTVGKSIGIIAVFVLGYWLFSRLAALVQHLCIRRFGVDPQVASVIRRWSMIFCCIALVVLVLNLARIPLSVFAFLGGALAIGFGFGAQTVIKNVLSGLIVLFERKVRVGDIVELGGVTGHVVAVDLRATTVRGFNGIEALIPNANFVENQVVNWTYSNPHSRREIKVGVAYGSDVRKVEGLFLLAAMAHSQVLRDPAPEVFFDDFADSALSVSLVYWVELDDDVGPRRIASDLRFDIYERLGAAGIVIAFPQQDVHVNFAGPLPAAAADKRLGAVHER